MSVIQLVYKGFKNPRKAIKYASKSRWELLKLCLFDNPIFHYLHNKSPKIELMSANIYWDLRKIENQYILSGKRDKIGEPFEIIWVNPSEIEFMSLEKFDSWEDTGKVKGGDWDMSNIRFEDNAPYWGSGINDYGISSSVYRAMEEHFCNGLNWGETEFVKEVIKTVESGVTVWHGCECVSEVYDRCDDLDKLYIEIKKNGYKTQRELIYTQKKSIDGEPKELYEEIFVNIGRDGKFLVRGGGNHRLCIAKLLNIDKVPVIPVVRHRQWQSIRKEINSADTIEEVSQTVQQYIDHPDIKNLV